MISSYYWDSLVLSWGGHLNPALRPGFMGISQPWWRQESTPPLTPPTSDDQDSRDGSNDQPTIFKTPVNAHQAKILEESYRKCCYPSKEDRNELALKLNLSEKKVTIWFQNRRAKQNRKDKMKKKPGRKPLMTLPNSVVIEPLGKTESGSNYRTHECIPSCAKTGSPERENVRFCDVYLSRRTSTPVPNTEQIENIPDRGSSSNGCSRAKEVEKRVNSVFRPSSSFRINGILGLPND